MREIEADGEAGHRKMPPSALCTQRPRGAFLTKSSLILRRRADAQLARRRHSQRRRCRLHWSRGRADAQLARRRHSQGRGRGRLLRHRPAGYCRPSGNGPRLGPSGLGESRRRERLRILQRGKRHRRTADEGATSPAGRSPRSAAARHDSQPTHGHGGYERETAAPARVLAHPASPGIGCESDLFRFSDPCQRNGAAYIGPAAQREVQVLIFERDAAKLQRGCKSCYLAYQRMPLVRGQCRTFSWRTNQDPSRMSVDLGRCMPCSAVTARPDPASRLVTCTCHQNDSHCNRNDQRSQIAQ